MPRQRSKEKYNKLHSEIISKRHQKKEKKKKKSIQKLKSQKVKEYLELEKLNESQEKKTTTMNLMNLIEEIKDEGMNDKRYMDIMDQLMILHKQDEKKIHVLDTFNEFTRRTPIINEERVLGSPPDYYSRIRYRDMMFRNPPTYEFINNDITLHVPGGLENPAEFNIGSSLDDEIPYDPDDVN